MRRTSPDQAPGMRNTHSSTRYNRRTRRTISRRALAAAVLLLPIQLLVDGSPVLAQDAYEPDDVYTSATVLTTAAPQLDHSIDPVGDVDPDRNVSACSPGYVVV